MVPTEMPKDYPFNNILNIKMVLYVQEKSMYQS